MSINELQARLSQLVDDVVPDPDPFERLMSRRRRRSRTRMGSIVAVGVAVVVASVAAPMAMHTAVLDKPFAGYPVESEWTWKLLSSPTRGNMSLEYVNALTHEFDRGPLPSVRVLFAMQTAEMTQVVVAYHSDTHAYVLARAGEADASAAELAKRPGSRGLPTGTTDGVPAAPFLVTYSGLDAVTGAVIGLAPQGCEISTSVHAAVRPDGLWQRAYEPEPTKDYAVNYAKEPAEVWQVTCGKEIREVRPARRVDRLRSSGFSMGPETNRGSPDAATDDSAAYAYNALRFVTGVGDRPSRIWGGSIAGIDEPASVVGPLEGLGVAVLHFGTGSRSLIALEPEGSHILPPAPPDPAFQAITSTAITDGSGLIAIRVPKREPARAVLTDRVLVIAPEDATTAEALDARGNVIATGQLSQGIGLLAFVIGAAASIRAGAITTRFSEPREGARVYGDQLIYDWQV